ncbi:hypothetical protein BIT28_00520 [Photobacterium proteolyticum]|uniref:Alpha-1,4 glucan phosphorylase n=4 Tax=Photobacterium TaxID=657 RepID=A0A1Q9H7J5_9GAMM|nr:hypothetical protein BIT28_00520 [Photobacterium proteolyticum]
MKFAMNGALTIGTMDGANVEMREEVGDDNIFIFGLLVDEVQKLKEEGYDPYRYYHADSLLRAALDLLETDEFTPGYPGQLAAIRHNLLDGGDPYLVLADFADYVKTHEKIDAEYRDQKNWARKAILNTALMSKFSSDRSIRDYANNIWNLEPVNR